MSGSGGYVGTVQASQSKEEDLLRDKHNYYLQHLDDDKESLEYMMSEHLRMGGVYWGVSAMALLRRLDDERRDSIVEWILRCRDPKTPGGFGPNVGHDADITATHYALLVLCIFDATDKLDREGVVAFIAGLQQNDGSFAGDHWGEVDVRFAYCALSALTILDALDSIDVDACVGWILRCMNYEGSFGPVPRAESHAAYVFCAVQALALVDALGAIDVDQLGWWLCERQTPSGGFNGRPEKAPDVCYSWWILSALATIDRVHWIDVEKLADFIIAAQDGEDGGIADRPGDVPDVFHTFFGLAGLSLMRRVDLAPIHCVYALPLEVVERMNLPPILPMYDSRQDAAERCPVASEAQKQASGKVIMDYAYGGGPLLLSEVAQHLDQTFCSRDKCHMGIISAGGGSGPDEQGVLFSKLDAASPGKAGDATFSHWGEGPMSAQKIIFCPDPDKGKAAKKLYDWLNNEKQAGIAKDEVYFFDDHTGNAAEMAEFGFNGREIACEPRDQMIGDGIVGLCGALLREIQREKGIKTCKQLIEDGFY